MTKMAISVLGVSFSCFWGSSLAWTSPFCGDGKDKGTSHGAGDPVRLGGAAKCVARGAEWARIRGRVFLSSIMTGHLRQVT